MFFHKITGSCWDNNPAIFIAAGLLEQYKLKDQSAVPV